ncbi:DUF5336 domain-containing protein [Mycobacterium sp. Dal123C01]|uniref:DUF5336 domain-containing protein n=1 Tax=Mycobacterium sp. Dal123C01 TaxID=3457577 RepID=UPI00403E9D62
MTNTKGHSAYAGYGRPDSAQSWHSSGPRSPEEQADGVSRSLWALAAVLGPATFAVDLGSPTLLGYPVRISVLAAIVAAVGLLPGQATRGWIVVALAVTGCLDAVAVWIKADETGWALTVVVVLNSLQAVAAVGALLRESREPGSAESEGVSDYSAYTRLAEAYQAYATQYQQLFSAPHSAAGQAGAQAEAEATAGVRGDTAQESFAAMQAKYARHGVVGTARQSRGVAAAPATPSTADTGVPGANRVAPESYPDRLRQRDASGGGVEQSGL